MVVGCSKSSKDEEAEEATDMVTMKKWLVDVRCDGCKGLFYRSAPNVIVPDADWPRNGDVVVGYEIPNVPGKWCGCNHHERIDSKSNAAFLERVDSTAKRLLLANEQ